MSSTTFSINGKPYTVKLSDLPADITLNTFIREHAGLPGTKFMCQEGGCGVCICVVTGKHPLSGQLETWAVNSCLTLLNSCDNLDILTTEGLGNKRDGYHPIQKRLAKMNGTQCGYCSPGFAMNMYALLKSKGGKITMEEVENSFGGNICRCTGYRPILDAMKSFAIDSNIEVPAECRDIEDLSAKMCPKTGQSCSGSCKLGTKRESVQYSDGSRWFWPISLADIFSAFENIKMDKYILVAGNTAHGVYRRSHDVKNFIDVNGVAELRKYAIGSDTITLGGGLSLTEAMKVFQEASKKAGFEYCQQLWNHFDLIANIPVRNMGTLAGNLAIKHQHRDFPSDIYVLFEALNAKVIIYESASVKKTVTLQDYLNTLMNRKVVSAFILPSYPRQKFIFESYKIMPRAQNAHAYVNAAFLVGLDPSSAKVSSARLCFGGINANFVHAEAVESYLVGKTIFDELVVSQALRSLSSHLKADVMPGETSQEYREKLAQGLLYKFLLSRAPTGVVSETLLSGGKPLKRPVSSGRQTFQVPDASNGDAPIYQEVPKIEGVMQTAGESMYANDVPNYPNQVWVTFVLATKIGATVTNIDATEALKLPGVVALFTAKDIPGLNSFITNEPFFFSKPEEMLHTGPVAFHGQPVALIAAESQALAERAAKLVRLTYSSGSEQIMCTLDSVLNNACKDRMDHTIKSMIPELKISEQFDTKASGKLDLGAQYHFFMEPHSSVVIPEEDGLQVYSATQWADGTQRVIAQLLNMKVSEVNVVVRRLGGGFGGKGTRPGLIAGAAALAAYKLKRPARCVMSLESTMTILGKRWPFHCDYDFYAKKDGKIVAIKSEFYEDAGWLPNESPMMHTQMLSQNFYTFSDNFKLDGYLVITDSPNSTACRGPGSVEGIALIENIIEHIAFELDMDPLDVRLINMIPNHKIGDMVQHFLGTSDYRQRRKNIIAFNEKNRWRKKGLGLTCMEYHMGYFGGYPATVTIFHGDGTVLISHGGIEMGQGMNTKVAQVAASILGIPIEMIRIEASNSLNGGNAMVTGGSIGSESVCYAIRNCCTTLADRLRPVQETMKDASWPAMIAQAHMQQVNLIASDICKMTDMKPYTVCIITLTEVEVDILTGNYLVKRVDILEDVGQSLNPAIDIGQIEGAFIMGLGYWTSERFVVDEATGEPLTTRSWNYKPPGAKDIPIDFRVEILPNSSNEGGFMRSKATGEPSICTGISVGFALQQAIQSARKDAGLNKQWVNLTAPMTPEHVLLSAGTNVNMFKLQ